MHLDWIKNGFTKTDICKMASFISNEDPFQNITMSNIQKEMGGQIEYKDTLLASDFEKITFLFLNYSERLLDLSFLKYCINLEEIVFGRQNLYSLDLLRNLDKIKKIDARNNKIIDIDCLYSLKDLEELNLEMNPINSLKAVKHLKHLKKINIDTINDENEVIHILKNNNNCSIKYILKGDTTDFSKFIFPNYFIYISKQQNKISILLEARNETLERDPILDFPAELISKSTFDDNYIAKIKQEVTIRFHKIYGSSTKLNDSKLLRYNEFYSLEYSHSFQ